MIRKVSGFFKYWVQSFCTNSADGPGTSRSDETCTPEIISNSALDFIASSHLIRTIPLVLSTITWVCFAFSASGFLHDAGGAGQRDSSVGSALGLKGVAGQDFGVFCKMP